MKNQYNLRGTSNVLFFGVFVFTLFTFAKPNLGVIDHFKVGDVVYSVLTPEQFTQVHGAGWSLMDGRVIDQQYDLRRMFGWTNVPDARGLFFRSMNLGRDKATGDGGADNLNNRVIASYQGDVLGTHFHYLSNTDLGTNATSNFLSQITQNGPSPVGHANLEYRLVGTNREPTLFKSSNSGDVETRPRNIALYTYIKVNEQ